MPLYANDGTINVTAVDGTSYTGIYAQDGSLNVIESPGDGSYVGLYHPCGAFWVTPVDGTTLVPINAPDGSMNVVEGISHCGAMNTTVVSGSLFGDAVAPTITSSNTITIDEGDQLAHELTADEDVTWSIIGGADQAQFDVDPDTGILTWVGDGTQSYNDPQDADTNNTYVVQVQAEDAAENTSNQTITVTVDQLPAWLVFLVAGQSNNFYGATLDEELDIGHARLYQYPPRTGGTGTADTVTLASEPLGWEEYSASAAPDGKIGYAVAFFRDYYLPANPGHTVVLVPYAVGGTSLAPASNGWDPDATPGALLTGAITQVGDAITAAATYFGETVTYGGTLWHQGEGDLQETRPSMEYRSQLNGLLDYVRNNITGAQSVPFIAGGLSDGTYTTDEIESSPPWHSTSTGTMWQNFLSTLGTKFAYAGYADSQSPSALGAAAIHFTAAEQRTMAARYWTAWQAALTNDAPACTWDPYDTKQDGTAVLTFSNGNLDATGNGTAGWKSVRATTGRQSGKYYFEVKITASADDFFLIGIANAFSRMSAELGNSGDAGCSAGVYGTFGQQLKNFTSVNSITLGALNTDDVFGIAVDLDNGKAWFSQNGTYTNSGDPAAGTDEWISWTPASVGRIWPALSIYESASNTARLLPTAASQTHGPPTGFSAWEDA